MLIHTNGGFIQKYNKFGILNTHLYGEVVKTFAHNLCAQLGWEWTYNNSTLAYSTYVTFTDGTATRRERPQLLFSEDGNLTPLFLTNGVHEVDSS